MEPRQGRKAVVRNMILSPFQGSALRSDPTPGLHPGLLSFGPPGLAYWPNEFWDRNWTRVLTALHSRVEELKRQETRGFPSDQNIEVTLPGRWRIIGTAHSRRQNGRLLCRPFFCAQPLLPRFAGLRQAPERVIGGGRRMCAQGRHLRLFCGARGLGYGARGVGRMIGGRTRRHTAAGSTECARHAPHGCCICIIGTDIQ